MATTKTLVEIEHSTSYGITYDKELLLVDKTLIDNAISALETVISYMPHVKTEVTRFQHALNQDVARMELVLNELRKLSVRVDTSKPQG